MGLLDCIRGAVRQPAPAPPAPDPAAEAAQREAAALRETAQELGEINPSDARYW